MVENASFELALRSHREKWWSFWSL